MSKPVTYAALPPDLTGPWAYMDMSGSGRALEWAKTDAQKAALSDKELTLILPGENIRRVWLDLPGIRGRELQSAIEFDLEDRLGGSLSAEVICTDRKKPGHVAIVSDGYKTQLTETLTQYGLTPESILIDYELIGEGQNFEIGERLLKGGLDGFALGAGWQSLVSEPIDFAPLQPAELFSRFHDGIKSERLDPLDLRNSLGVKSASDFNWQPWAKLAALILAVTALPFMFDKYSEARALGQQAKADRETAQALYQEATGTRSQDPARAISQQLRSGQASTGFLDMSAVLFASLSDVEGVEIDTLRYDPRQKLLQLSIRYPSFEAGEQLEQAVSQRGGRLAAGGIRERGDTLIGEASFALSSGER